MGLLLISAENELVAARVRWIVLLNGYMEETENLKEELSEVYKRRKNGRTLRPSQQRKVFRKARSLDLKRKRLAEKSKEAEFEMASIAQFINSTLNN